MGLAPGSSDQTLIKAEPGTLIWAEPLPEGGRAFSRCTGAATSSIPCGTGSCPIASSASSSCSRACTSAAFPARSRSPGRTAATAPRAPRVLVTREIPSVARSRITCAGIPIVRRISRHFLRLRGACTMRRCPRRLLCREYPALGPSAGPRPVPRHRLRARLPVFAERRRHPARRIRPARHAAFGRARDADHGPRALGGRLRSRRRRHGATCWRSSPGTASNGRGGTFAAPRRMRANSWAVRPVERHAA